eukprot:TRINITY_DN2570_c0_g1_i1.p1 TRINITY_DN2570_c0_g1~~TRINITY_DN2570_c0_g1_i1.p1  ORF type:complete len:684 (+),score=66.44 TRINITY_DN2570_c0_g1_i1:74-2125(+)
MAGLVDYEKMNNLFLQALRSTSLRDALPKLSPDRWAVLVPNSVKLDEIGLENVSEEFLRTHTITFDDPPAALTSGRHTPPASGPPAAFTTLNGLRGTLLSGASARGAGGQQQRCDVVEVIVPEPVPASPSQPAPTGDGVHRQTLQVLRQTEITIRGAEVPTVPVLIVHDAIRAGWCSSAAPGDPLVGGGDLGRFQGEPEQQNRQPAPAKSVEEKVVPKYKPFSFRSFQQKMGQTEAAHGVKKIHRFIADVERSDMSPDLLPAYVRKNLEELPGHLQKCSIWMDADERELDFLQEGVEKYVLWRIYNKVFSTASDKEQDEALSKKLRGLATVIKPSNLEVNEKCLEHSDWADAQKELNRLKDYRAPRDKLICISNACKLIFQVLHSVNPDKSMGADEFLPCLILLVGLTNPDNLCSNAEFIQRYRNPARMSSEQGYYFCNLQSVIYFWQTADAESLHIDAQLFDRINGDLEDRGVEMPDFSQLNDQVTGHDEEPTANRGSPDTGSPTPPASVKAASDLRGATPPAATSDSDGVALTEVRAAAPVAESATPQPSESATPQPSSIETSKMGLSFAAFKDDPRPSIETSKMGLSFAAFKDDPRPSIETSKMGLSFAAFKDDPRPAVDPDEVSLSGIRAVLEQSRADPSATKLRGSHHTVGDLPCLYAEWLRLSELERQVKQAASLPA